MLNRPLSASGFTLIELITTLTIAGILTAIAVPTFNSVISSNRLTAYTNEFVTALNLARSEAIKRGTKVTIMRNKDSVDYAWEKGWDVFIDSDNNNTLNDDGDANLCEAPGGAATEDCLLRTYSALPTGFTLKSNFNLKRLISFNAMGKSISETGGLGVGALKLCDINKADRLKTAKVIIISSTGRVRMGIDPDKDGIPNDATGIEIQDCAP
jgi:type IV fimbrial biogenesis protein FimT